MRPSDKFGDKVASMLQLVNTAKKEAELQTAEMRDMRGRKPGTYLLPGLARVRDERGYSMREVAVLSGLTLDTIWRVENLQRGAEARTRRSLARVLDTTIKELRTPDEAVNED